MTIAIIDPCHDPNALSDLQQFDRRVEGAASPPGPALLHAGQ